MLWILVEDSTCILPEIWIWNEQAPMIYSFRLNVLEFWSFGLLWTELKVRIYFVLSSLYRPLWDNWLCISNNDNIYLQVNCISHKDQSLYPKKYKGQSQSLGFCVKIFFGGGGVGSHLCLSIYLLSVSMIYFWTIHSFILGRLICKASGV